MKIELDSGTQLRSKKDQITSQSARFKIPEKNISGCRKSARHNFSVGMTSKFSDRLGHLEQSGDFCPEEMFQKNSMSPCNDPQSEPTTPTPKQKIPEYTRSVFTFGMISGLQQKSVTDILEFNGQGSKRPGHKRASTGKLSFGKVLSRGDIDGISSQNFGCA
jgi:hypothetical protein